MKKLNASSIYYALFLSIVIAILLGGMVLFSGMNRQLGAQFDVEEILMDNALSGVEYGLANYAELPNNEPLNMRLFGEGIDSVRITKKQWGAFTIISSTALHKNQSFTKVALTGHHAQTGAPNLFVCDQGRPIAICGDTRLEGKVLLPESGLKRAYIEGKNYTGDEMVYGTTGVSEKNLPPVDEQFISQLGKTEALIQPWDNDADSIAASFSGNALHFIDDGYTMLQNIVVNGQVMIESRDSIFVSSSAQLENVILKSPVVYFEDGFTGNAQVFATKRIVLGKNVHLLYPSVLGLIEEEFPTEENAEVVLCEQSQLIGSVFLFSREENFRLPVQLNVGLNAAIDGFAYCRGKTQLMGTVNGHLYTDKFYLETRASKYENHLLNAKLLDQLPDDFVYINLLKTESKLKRIEWLN